MHGSVSAGFDGMSRARTLAAVLICLGSTFPAAMAQPGPHTEDAAVARAMGSGVHSYFGGDYQRAYEDLTEAIAAGSGDPRALYFRGLAARRMGRIDEAEAEPCRDGGRPWSDATRRSNRSRRVSSAARVPKTNSGIPQLNLSGMHPWNSSPRGPPRSQRVMRSLSPQ